MFNTIDSDANEGGEIRQEISLEESDDRVDIPDIQHFDTKTGKVRMNSIYISNHFENTLIFKYFLLFFQPQD